MLLIFGPFFLVSHVRFEGLQVCEALEVDAIVDSILQALSLDLKQEFDQKVAESELSVKSCCYLSLSISAQHLCLLVFWTS